MTPPETGPRPQFLDRRMLRVLALLLAIITWYAIREAISFETVVSDVPVQIAHDPGWAVLEKSVDTVDVRFRGARGDISELTRDRVRVDVDARGDHRNRARVVVKMRPENVRAPNGARPVATPVSIQPDEITFSMDREGERQVPVKAEVQETPPEGFEIERIQCTPATVLLSGPLSKLQDVEAIRTVPIDLQGRVQSFQTRVNLVPPHDLGTARLAPDRVQVDVGIVEHAATRVIEGVPVRLLTAAGAAADITVQPGLVRVTVSGRSAALAGLAPTDVRAFVDCSGLEPGSRYDLPMQVSLPAGFRCVTLEPASATVKAGDGR